MEKLQKNVINHIDYYLKPGIYSIWGGNKYYIGSAKDIGRRWNEHLYSLRNKKHRNQKLQNFYNKYGEKSLAICIIEECDYTSLLDREQYYLDNFNPFFNIKKCANRGENSNSKLNKKLIEDIAVLYNNKHNCKEIGEMLNINPNVINNLVLGNTYSEFKYLFNYRPFNKGSKQSIETINKRIEKLKGVKRTRLEDDIIINILQDYSKYSASDIALKYNLKESIVKSLLFNKKTVKGIKNKLDFSLSEIRKPIQGDNNKQQRFTIEEINKIVKLYNSGIKPINIAKKLFNNENLRFAIIKLAKGITYKEYSHLFKGKDYFNKKGDLSSDKVLQIKEKLKVQSAREVSKLFNIPIYTIKAIKQNLIYKYIN